MPDMTDNERDKWLRELYGENLQRYDNYPTFGHWTECYDVPMAAMIYLNCLNPKLSGEEREQWKQDHFVGDSTKTRWGFGDIERKATDE